MTTLPSGWKLTSVDDCCDILDSMRVPVNEDDRRHLSAIVPYYGANGQVGFVDRSLFDEPLILLAEDGGNFDDFATRPIAYRINGPSWVNNHAHILRPRPDTSFDFVFYSLQHRDIRVLVAGGTRSKLTLSALRALTFPLPPLNEQRRIADVLAIWDRAIESAQTLVVAKQRLYEAARQHLIDSYQRNADSDDGWRSIEFGELAEELGERNRGRLGASSVMGVLKSQGIVPMRENVMANDLDRYLVVPPGAFAYNPMRLNIGSIAQSGHASDILVSPDYVVFNARAGKGSAAFLRHFIGSKRWRDTMELAASGSVRLRIYFDGLAEMPLRAPSLVEQESIAKVLDAAQADISLATKKLESLRTQKRGLMQKLLTGAWRLSASGCAEEAA